VRPLAPRETFREFLTSPLVAFQRVGPFPVGYPSMPSGVLISR
jgi:hypothetical protein